MQQLVYFIEKYKYFLLFLFLQTIAFTFTIQYKSYHKSKFVNSANTLTGGLLKRSNQIFEYSKIKDENLRLSAENAHLKTLLSALQKNTVPSDSVQTKFNYIPAKIIQNNYSKSNNILTLDKGSNQGITPDMGVVNSTGIVGVVNKVSKNYSTVISILHSNSSINAKLKKNNYFGTVKWLTSDYTTCNLVDMQRQADIKIGDTIVTGGKSVLFPMDIPIGIISDYKGTDKKYTSISIKLFNDMSSLLYVNVIKNKDRNEILELTNDD